MTVQRGSLVWTLGLTHFLFLGVWDSPWNLVPLTLLSTGVVGHDITIFMCVCTLYSAPGSWWYIQWTETTLSHYDCTAAKPPEPSGTHWALEVLQTGQVMHTNPSQSIYTCTYWWITQHKYMWNCNFWQEESGYANKYWEVLISLHHHSENSSWPWLSDTICKIKPRHRNHKHTPK